ncbi:hypothetical protein [Nocardia spumae]|uniref:hypothetical protein n=1 Tax=Nocardia spumae TaxID=2887190 RepID=UPI001D14F10F|nr:hypothetical protein [Nocardia spumae]
MSRRQEPWTGKDTAQCFGMLALMAGGLTACTGHLSIDDMRAYTHTVGELASEWALPVLAGAGGTVLAVGVLLVVLRHLRGALVAMMRTVWLYKRRWAAVLADLELTVTSPSGTKVPRLRSVVRFGDQDVVTVQMARGQSATLWHEKSAALAYEFGAVSAQVRLGAQPHREVEIVFTRSAPRAPRREQLALPAPKVHPIPLTLPAQPQVLPAHPQYRPKGAPGMAVRVTGIRLQIVWAIARPHGQNAGRWSRISRKNFGVRGELRWNSAWATAV